ncbi:hypothetical protein Ancab_040115 [Ancistrocladus abbreviatus]
MATFSSSSTLEILLKKKLKKTKRLSVPTICLKHLPGFEPGRHQINFTAVDEEEHSWEFRCSKRRRGRAKPVLCGGWLSFIREKGLREGDVVILYKDQNHPNAPGGASYRIKYIKAIWLFGVDINPETTGVLDRQLPKP